MKKNFAEIQSIKGKHRLELVMADTGEKFSPGIDRQAKSLTTPGLMVDLDRQIWRIAIPGQDEKSGDVFDWLTKRYGWSFRMALRYLENRAPDFVNVVSGDDHRGVSKASKADFSKGLQEEAPLADKWQEKAVSLWGNEIRVFFSKSSFEILNILSSQPARFFSLVDMAIDECAECGKEIDWIDESSRVWLVLPTSTEMFSSSHPLEAAEDDIIICKECYRDKVRMYQAILCCYWSAAARERKKRKERDSRAGGSVTVSA